MEVFFYLSFHSIPKPVLLRNVPVSVNKELVRYVCVFSSWLGTLVLWGSKNFLFVKRVPFANNYGSILNFFSKVFEFIVHYHISNFLKFKLNHPQHVSVKSVYTINSLATFINVSRPLVCSRSQAYPIYFDLSNEGEFILPGD